MIEVVIAKSLILIGQVHPENALFAHICTFCIKDLGFTHLLRCSNNGY